MCPLFSLRITCYLQLPMYLTMCPRGHTFTLGPPQCEIKYVGNQSLNPLLLCEMFLLYSVKCVSCHVCQCFKLCISSLLMQISATVMDFNKGNLLFYLYTIESVTINQNTTDAFVSDWPKIICRHCVDQQTDSLVPNFSRIIDRDAIEKWGRGKGLVLAHCNKIWKEAPDLPAP